MAGAFGPAPRREWMQIARSLGSDVPFFLAGTAALVEGMGERVTPAGAIPPWNVLIVKPPVDVSTAQAYREIDAAKRPQRPRSGCVSIAMLEALQRAEFPRVQALLQNDFHDVIATSTPQVMAALDALRVAGATNALLAGSGSCVFALSPEKAHIEAIARHRWENAGGTRADSSARFGVGWAHRGGGSAQHVGTRRSSRRRRFSPRRRSHY
jgi:4-diphosphocytidyl-2-C-methyl-D-erythritol kinase